MYILKGLWRGDQHLFGGIFHDALEIRISRSVGIGVHTYCFSFSLLFCHKDVQKTRKSKYLGEDWEATVLISNRLPQLNDCNKILTELFIQKSKADILDNHIKHS